MKTLTRAHDEMFRRGPDEQFRTFAELSEHCRHAKEASQVQWFEPKDLQTEAIEGRVGLRTNGEVQRLSEWSFSQLCRLASVHKGTVNRLSEPTANAIFSETLPRNGKPLQVYSLDKGVRSIHGAAYTRLYNADLLATVSEFATDFEAPQEAINGGSGLYCGEQDMFCFFFDPLGWVEIDGEAFAPGFFVWNSEVGCRSVGIQTFWFQAVCQNHIVWDAVEVVDFARKHTTNVSESLGSISSILNALVARRDERRDAFSRVIEKAMRTRLGGDAEDVLAVLDKHGVSKPLAKQAIALAKGQGGFSIFSVVDALTRISQDLPFAGERANADSRASQLLALVA